MRHFFLLQPVPQPLQFRDNRSEPSRLLSRFPLQWPCHYADGQKLLPDINAGASFDCCTDHVRSPFGDWRTVDSSWNTFFLGSTAPFGGASRPPGQFRFRANCAPLPITAALSSPATDCTPPPFSFPGAAKTGHPLSFQKGLRTCL